VVKGYRTSASDMESREGNLVIVLAAVSLREVDPSRVPLSLLTLLPTREILGRVARCNSRLPSSFPVAML
jgi:hypothetical protein